MAEKKEDAAKKKTTAKKATTTKKAAPKKTAAKKEAAPKAEAPKAAPAAAPKKTTAKADDLKKIEGIGPKIAEVLTEAGIGTFAALAKSTPEAIKEILSAHSRLASKDPSTWCKQAELAAEGKWDELKKWQDELDGGKA